MANYPNSTKQFVTKIDKNAGGISVGPEYFNVPTGAPYHVYLDHVPKDSATTAVGASGGASWTEVFVPPTSAGQYQVDYTTGEVTFNSANSGAATQAVYQNLGDDIMAEHVNDLQNEVMALEDELGSNPSGPYSNLGDRLNAMSTSISASGINGQLITDNTVRAGALGSDIKGASWDTVGRPTLQSVQIETQAHVTDSDGAHASTAISATGPGTTAITTVQGHINLVGSVPATTTNPHGMSLNDFSPTYIDVPLRVQSGTTLIGKFMTASGNYIAINTQAASVSPVDGDSSIFFYEGGSITGGRIGWNDSASRFEINKSAMVFGDITPSGSILPEASGARSIGTQATPFASGCFDTIEAGGGGYLVGNSTGATGSFTSNNGKTITVKGGIIVSIV